MNKKVIITAVIVIAIAAIFLFFKFFQKECVPLEITVQPEKPVQGQLVTFKSNAEEGENISWEFGDSTSSAKGMDPTHKYKEAGKYTVKAIRDGDCPTTIEISILAKRRKQFINPTLNFPSEIHVNEPITFTDETNEASMWNWKISETQEMGSEKSFNTTFKKEGKYTISLNLNGDNIKGDTTFVIDVIGGVASSTPKAAIVIPEVAQKTKVEPKPVAKVETKPETPAKNDAKAKADAKLEAKAKADEEAKLKAEAKLNAAAAAKAAAAEAAAEKARKVAEAKAKSAPITPLVPSYLSDLDFSNSFISISNALANEDDNASNEWRDKIVPQTGTKGTMKVIIKIGDQMIEKTLEGFKKTQLISSEPYKVESVKDIKRGPKNGPISEITIIVTKN